jgi:hypothetical protein
MFEARQRRQRMAQDRMRRLAGSLCNEADATGLLVKSRIEQIGRRLQDGTCVLQNTIRSNKIRVTGLRASSIRMRAEAIHT